MRASGLHKMLSDTVLPWWRTAAEVVAPILTCCVLHVASCWESLSTKSEKNEVWRGEHAEDVLKISTKLMVVPDLDRGRCREQRVEVQIFSSSTESHSLV